MIAHPLMLQVSSQHSSQSLPEASKVKVSSETGMYSSAIFYGVRLWYITAGCAHQNIASGSKFDTGVDVVTSDVQKLGLSSGMDSQENADLVSIEEWVRQTSAMAVAPDTLMNETRDPDSPTLTESSIKVSEAGSSKQWITNVYHADIRVTVHKKLLTD